MTGSPPLFSIRANFPEPLIAVTIIMIFQGLADKDPQLYTPCSVISLAGGFCRYSGIGYPHPDEEIDLPFLPDALALELNSVMIDELPPRFKEAFRASAAFFFFEGARLFREHKCQKKSSLLLPVRIAGKPRPAFP